MQLLFRLAGTWLKWQALIKKGFLWRTRDDPLAFFESSHAAEEKDYHDIERESCLTNWARARMKEQPNILWHGGKGQQKYGLPRTFEENPWLFSTTSKEMWVLFWRGYVCFDHSSWDLLQVFLYLFRPWIWPDLKFVGFFRWGILEKGKSLRVTYPPPSHSCNHSKTSPCTMCQGQSRRQSCWAANWTWIDRQFVVHLQQCQ